MQLNLMSKYSQQCFNFKAILPNDLPTQNTTHIRTSYHASHNSNTNRINQEQEKANLYSNRGTIYPINPYIL